LPLGVYNSAAFTTASGVAVAPNADVEVRRESDSGLASIYSDRAGASPITQPGFQADSLGRFDFYAAGISGGYQVKVTKGAETQTVRYQAVGTAKEFDADPFWAAVWAAATAAAARLALGFAAIAAKGDSWWGSAADTIVKLAVGANGTILMADSTAAAGVRWETAPPHRNLIINGSFAVNQRVSTAAGADDTYGHDRWYRLSQANPIAVSDLADVENGLPFMARLTQSNAAAQRMGYAQIIEGRNCKHLRGKAVSFRFGRVRLSTSANVRYALLEWTGTEDAVTSDVVNDWASADYTDGAAKFFVDTGFLPNGVAQQVLTAATLADGVEINVTLGSTFNNLVLFAWTEATVAQNVTLDLGKAQLEQSLKATEFEALGFDAESESCERYYRKTFPYATAPAQNAGTTDQYGMQVQIAGTSSQFHRIPFPKRMRVAPTIITYNPSAANAQPRNQSTGVDGSGVGQVDVAPHGFTMLWTGDAGALAAHRMGIHWTAAAEL